MVPKQIPRPRGLILPLSARETKSAKTEPAPARIDCNQDSLLQLLPARIQCAHHHRTDRRWENILRPDLNHAWLARFAVCEQGAEIEIVSEDDESVSCSVIHDHAVRCGGVSHFRLVNVLES